MNARALALPRLRLGTRTLLWIEGACVVLIPLVTMLVSSHVRSTSMNNYVRLADGILHGHLWIDWPGRWMDAVEYRGQHYGVDGPFPAFLMLPLVALFGMHTNQTLVAIVVGTVGLLLAWLVLVRWGVAALPRRFLMLFLFAGTDWWWCAELGDVWFIAHLCAATGVFAIVLELTGRRRGWLIGLLAIAAIESRNSVLLAVPFIVYGMWSGDIARFAASARGDDPRDIPVVDEPRAMGQFAVLMALGLAGWVTLNELMWGSPVDIGHTLYYHQDSWGHPDGSPFSLAYLPYQIYSYFVRGPEFVQWLQVLQWPYLKVDPNGIALTFTSPALILAFLACEPRVLVRWLWVTTALVAGPDFLYYLNGWYQFGMRHALDFEPFLFLLMALACRRAMPRWGMVLCVYSAIVGAWGVWWWNVFMRTGD